MRSDPSLVLAAIPQSGFVLGFAADELRHSKNFVLHGVKLNGYALIGAGAKAVYVGKGEVWESKGIYVEVMCALFTYMI